MRLLTATALALAALLSPPLAPGLRGQESGRELVRDSLRVEGQVRAFSLYVPPMPPPSPPVLFVLHCGNCDGDQMRQLTGSLVEEEADRLGFLVVYPEGIGRSWNDCLRSAPYPANLEDVDDVRFLRAIVSRLRESHGIDPSRVWAFGFSNGAHLALRLALEAPDDFAGVAAVAASLPSEEEIDCVPSGRPASVMIVNGTADPINPFEGGEGVTGFAGRMGTVRSSREAARYFAELIEADEPPDVTLASSTAGSRIEISRWVGSEGQQVVLVTVYEGGHTIPGSPAAFPAEVGPVDRGFDSIAAAIDFFQTVSR